MRAWQKWSFLALFCMILYGLVFSAIHLHEIGERALRRALLILLWFTAVFFPLMLIDAAMSELRFLSISSS